MPMLDAATTAALASATDLDHQGCYGYRAGWIVAITHPQAEQHASSNLQRRGYRTFLPLIAVRIRDRVTPSLTRLVQRPLWPGYCFVAYDSRDPRRPIRETPGVRDLVRCGPEVQWVPDHALEAIQSALQAAEASAASSPLWKPGTPCSLISGPFMGLPAVATSFANDIANVSLMFLGHLRTVSVPLDCLRARDE